MNNEMTFPEYGGVSPYNLGLILRAIVGREIPSKTMIDLCCGNANTTRFITFKERTFVDIKKESVHDSLPNFYELDVLSDHPIFEKHYDVSFCTDGIEHLLKEDGIRLLQRMLNISYKPILFTPLGNHCVNLTATDPYEHKSGWLPSYQELKDWYKIIFPKFHPTLNIGAFIFWHSPDPDDFEKVIERIIPLGLGKYFITENGSVL
jgi:hypothetical protein